MNSFSMLQQFVEDIPLFVELSLIAIKQGDEESAKKILNGLAVVDPENTARLMGLGLIAMHKMHLEKAAEYFQEVLKLQPNNHRAKGFLAFSFVSSVLDEKIAKDQKVKKLQEGADLAEHLLAESQEPSTRKLAENLLQWIKEMKQKKR